MRLLQRLALLLFLIGASALHAQDKGYDVTSYDVKLQIVRTQNFVQGVVAMQAKATAALGSILQHLKSLTVDSVFIDGIRTTIIRIDSESNDGSYTVTTSPAIEKGASFSLKTYYHGTPANEGGTSPWGGVTNNGQMMFAMGVGFSAPFISCTRFWMPCYDLPDDKADSATLTFVVNDSDEVASNGERVLNDDNTSTHLRTSQWKVRHPVASYLLTFATGPFVEVNVAGPSGVPIQGFCYRSDSTRLANEFTRRIVRTTAFYDSLFGPYPFEKVGYVVAPIGSMEHQTMITLINQAIDTNSTTPQHELAHQWWGDWVTCKDFNDPWLNEGFATFCESLVLEHDVSVTRYWVKQHANISGAISAGSTIPMYGAPYYTSPRDNYPYAVIYQKGAAVLGMLRYMLGDSIFFPALRSYGNAHAYSVATSYDLEHSLEQFTGQDLKWFFDEWVFGTFYPMIKVSWKPMGSSYTVNLDQVQDSTKYRFFRMPVVIEARTKGGLKDREVVLMDSVFHTTAEVPCLFQPDTIVIDPDGALIKKIAGVTTLGVGENGAHAENSTNIRFSPNPSSGEQTDLYIRTSGVVGGVTVGQNADGYVLTLFDSGGHLVRAEPLRSVSVASAHAGSNAVNDEELCFKVRTAALASGTYFAKVLLNNTVVGQAQLVVTK